MDYNTPDVSCLPDVIRYFENLPPGRIHQGRGWYAGDLPCCIGAHLARLWRLSNDFTDGKEELARRLFPHLDDWAFVEAALFNLLRDHGAPGAASFAVPWERPPAEVFRSIYEAHGGMIVSENDLVRQRERESVSA